MNKVTERAEGYVWKYETQLGGYARILLDDYPRIIINLTVWQSLSSIKKIIWKTLRTKNYEHLGARFTPMQEGSMVLWDITGNERPEIPTAIERLNYLRKTVHPITRLYGSTQISLIDFSQSTNSIVASFFQGCTSRNVRGAGSRLGQGRNRRRDAVEVQVAISRGYYAYMYNGVPPVPCVACASCGSVIIA